MFNLKGPQGQNPRTTCGPWTEKRWIKVYGVQVSKDHGLVTHDS